MSDYKSGVHGPYHKLLEHTVCDGDDFVVYETARSVAAMTAGNWRKLPDIERGAWEKAAQTERAKTERRRDAKAYGIEVTIRRTELGRSLEPLSAVAVRMTATRVVMACGARYTRDDGSRHGRPRWGVHFEIEPEDLARLEELAAGRKSVDFIKDGKRAAKGQG